MNKIIHIFSSLIFSLVQKCVSLVYYAIIIGTVAGIVVSILSVLYLNGKGPLLQEVNVVIPSGASTRSIATQLTQAEVIEHPEIFSMIAVVLPYSNYLKAGEYSFSPGMTPLEVLNKLYEGKVVMRNITVAEGLLTFQILELLQNNPLLTGEIPEGVKEGELLPQTYDYHYGESRESVVHRMREAMKNTLDELWEARQEGLPLQTKEQALILASIIEKETGVAEERKRVAAVFINRLRLNMLLQTDPSVIYAVTEGRSLLGRALTHKDLAVDSPYNTYKYAGLPPTPIANPGRASIEAALNPMETREIYFVADGSGGHMFAETLQEHNKNVSQWRKIEKQARDAQEQKK